MWFVGWLGSVGQFSCSTWYLLGQWSLGLEHPRWHTSWQVVGAGYCSEHTWAVYGALGFFLMRPELLTALQPGSEERRRSCQFLRPVFISPRTSFLWSKQSSPSNPFSQFSSVTQLCPTLWDPMDCSTPGHPIHHQLLEFTQTHVHWVGDAIQPSHFSAGHQKGPFLNTKLILSLTHIKAFTVSSVINLRDSSWIQSPLWCDPSPLHTPQPSLEPQTLPGTIGLS